MPLLAVTPKPRRFAASDGVELVADEFGEKGQPVVVLLHGGGQTRHAWGDTAAELARRGRHVIALDARGHGDSDHSTAGRYDARAHVDDLAAVLDQLPPRPVLIGASMGGLAAMRLAGESQDERASALVLVDITPRVNRRGVDNIRAFMTGAPAGFADLEEAVEAVSAYLPYRRKPTRPTGLIANLREGADGRLRWHWDPRILDRTPAALEAERVELEKLVPGIRIPTLLVRGSQSDVVDEESEAHFRALLPTAEVAVVEGARHMVAGDSNQAFNSAIFEFLDRVAPSRS